VEVIIHAYREGRKIYHRGNFNITGKMTVEFVLKTLSQEIGEPLLEIVEDRSEYIILMLNDNIIDYKEEYDRIVTNNDSIKLFPQVVGG
jgi:molybdopterin converting factor small subunit